MLGLVSPLLDGLAATLRLTAGAALLSLPIALAAALARLSPWRAVRWPAIAYVEVFRGTSALVQLFWFYFVLPLFGLSLPAMAVGMVVLALNTGAYGAEVVRDAILAVPRGQWEAALNMGRAQTYMRIVIPQAIPPVVPALGNYLIAMFKDTPLLSAISVLELLQTAKVIGAETFHYVEPLTLVCVLFLAVSLVAVGGVRALKRRLAAALERRQ
jgi:polar amino acid transport system permease protein